MQIPEDVAQMLRDGHSNAQVSSRFGIHPVRVAEMRDALGLPGYYAMLPVYVAPDSQREHGTRAKYVVENCRCPRCRAANREAEGERSRLIAYGRWEPWVDAQPVYAHLRYLQSCGMGLRAVAAAADVERRRLQSILNGRPERGTGPQEKVRPALAAAVLAIEPTLDTLAATAVIGATGTVRRLQALVAVGWPQMRVAAEMGWTPTNLTVLMNRSTATVKTARLVREVYARLWNGDPLAHGASMAGIARAKKRAADARWAPPAAWDDDAIDNPSAFPDWTGHCGTPEGASHHHRHCIPLCDPCRKARSKQRAERKQRAAVRSLHAA